MINLLDNNEDGNPICPKCHSDNVEIYERYLKISIRGSRAPGHLDSQHYLCLDCRTSSFPVDKTLWSEILPDITNIVKNQFLKWIDYSREPKKGDKFKVDSFEIEIKSNPNNTNNNHKNSK